MWIKLVFSLPMCHVLRKIDREPKTLEYVATKVTNHSQRSLPGIPIKEVSLNFICPGAGGNGGASGEIPTNPTCLSCSEPSLISGSRKMVALASAPSVIV